MKKILKYLFLPFVSKKYDLEKYWWHRLMKIFYIFVILAFFIYINAKTTQYYDHIGRMRFFVDDPTPVSGWQAGGRITDLTLDLLKTYFLFIAMQFLYYKIFLYIVYGKR